MAGDCRHQVLQSITCQGELGEENKVGTLLASLPGKLDVFLQVGFQVAEAGIHLGEGKINFHLLILP